MRKNVLILALAVATMTALTACGKEQGQEAIVPEQEVSEEVVSEETVTEEPVTEEPVTEEAPAVAEETEVIGDMGPEDYPSNDFETRVGKTSFSSYDEIIGLLEGEEAYTYVDVKGYDGQVLVVACYTYDDLLGHFATIECTPYTMKPNGTVTADSMLYSGGTATPISIDDQGILYSVTHHTVEKLCYGDNGTDTPAIMVLTSVYTDAFDDNGEPQAVGGFVRTNNSLVDDDSTEVSADDVALLKQLFVDYESTQVLNFTRVNGDTPSPIAE